jgi:hypothetical protein
MRRKICSILTMFQEKILVAKNIGFACLLDKALTLTTGRLLLNYWSGTFEKLKILNKGIFQILAM